MVRCENVSLAFQSGRYVLDTLNVTVSTGQFVEVHGPSGSGKSSFLKLLNRILEPTSGRIFYRGEPLGHVPVTKLRQMICYVHQTPVLLSGSVRENILLPFTFKSSSGVTPPDDAHLERMLLDFLLSDVSLDDVASACSVGQKQRLCLIRSLLLKPEVLLLDEPTSALDPKSAAVVEDEIERVNRESGTTVFLVTHKPVGGKPQNNRRIWHCKDGRFLEE